MFDATTARLIREAPPLRGVNPQTLPQELTAVYAELTALRLRADDLTAQPERLLVLERLKRLAVVYEAVVDTGAQGDARRASAFVAGTAHQILARVMSAMYSAELDLLSAVAIHPNIAAPLLLLVAEQNADAREAARPLQGQDAGDLIRTALVETVCDLALERLEEILQRAGRLQQLVATFDNDTDVAIERALFGLCWAGIVHLAASLLNRDVPLLGFRQFDSPQATFDQVVRLSASEIPLPDFARPLLSTFSGPRHLARLLRHVADSLIGSGIISLPTPGRADAQFWGNWLRHRSRTKPILWRNHRNALAHGILEQGQSAVLVLPTGAGKTTLSELKIAAALARGLKVIFLVPTLALVDQLRDDLSETFPPTFADVEVSIDGDLMGLVIGPDLQSVEVMTPERCLALMSHAPDAVADVGLVVFDECHLLSPQGGGKRSLDAMLCLLNVLKHAPRSDLLLLSAMLSNAEEFAGWIAEVSGRPCQAFIDPWKPSRQARGIVTYERSCLDQIRQAAQVAARVRRRGGRAQRIDRNAIPYALFGLHQNWNPGTEPSSRTIPYDLASPNQTFQPPMRTRWRRR
jgi:RAD3-like DEAD/DEAH box helicase